jgi:hypothetical protein
MSPLSSRLLRFKEVNEITATWKLTNTEPTTNPLRVQNMHSVWMSPPGTNELQEAIWNSYRYHKLMKYTWKMANMRVFLETVTVTKATGSPLNAPAVTDTQIVELKDWVFWYWRMLVSGNTNPPDKNDEGRYTKFCRRDCNSSIRGYVPIPSKTEAWMQGSYGSHFASNAPDANLDVFLNSYLKAGTYGPNTSTATVPSPDLYIMPDDPYPKTFFPAPGGEIQRIVTLSVVADVYKYTTWKCKCPLTS